MNMVNYSIFMRNLNMYIYIMDGKLFYIVGIKKFKLMRLTIFNTMIYFLIYIYILRFVAYT